MESAAAILTGHDRPVEIRNVQIPELKPGQVLVQVKAAGICHTQLGEVRGRRGADPYIPHALGHEGAGIVLAIGADVKKVVVGDHVVLTWIKGQGCEVPQTVYADCATHNHINAGAITCFQNITVASENRVVKIDSKMPFDIAALLGCAVPTGAGLVRHDAKLQAGQSIAIIGVGGIGLSALIAAKAEGAGTIVAVDVQDDKLALACKLGATHTFNAKAEDPVAGVMALTNNTGVDIALECSGNKSGTENAFAMIRFGGGHCVLAGNLPYGQKMEIVPKDLIRGKQLTGSWGGSSRPDEDVPYYAEQYLAGKLPLDDLISHRIKLADINDAFDLIDRGEAARIIIEFPDAIA